MKIWRKGYTAKQWSDDPSKGRLRVRASHTVGLQFSMPSKGGGYTVVLVQFEPDDFSALLKAMIAVDEAATLHAIGESLVNRTPSVAVRPAVAGLQLASPQSEKVPA
jgi:hypothetical protein